MYKLLSVDCIAIHVIDQAGFSEIKRLNKPMVEKSKLGEKQKLKKQLRWGLLTVDGWFALCTALQLLDGKWVIV